MFFRKTGLEGVYVIEPELKTDGRGFFTRTFCKKELAEKGIDFTIAQMNQSLTKRKGAVRGMHYQKDLKAEDKIVSCLKGRVYDVAVDLRRDSPTYGKFAAQELSEENKLMMYIPKGLAHGFQTLANGCVMQYLMTEYYSPEHSSGARWDDPLFGIRWPLKVTDMSEKDKSWPLLAEGRKK